MAASAVSLPTAPPVPRTRLIGRAAEVTAARSLLLDEAVPLLTLTGPGGAGKTRLALVIAHDLADHFADGVAWADLAPLADPSLVATIVSRAVGLLPTPGLPEAEGIAHHLRSRQLLLLLDNCEHVLPAIATLVSTVLAACPGVHVLATSRAPLRVQGEHELPIGPLPLPAEDALSDGEALRSNDAVQLFLERARAVDPGFPVSPETLATIADICRHLDGLPLAIELAAARTRTHSPAEIRTRLERRLPLLTNSRRDAPVRQRTIRDTIAWSYDLLAADDQALFRQLCICFGGFTLEAAQAISGRAVEVDLLLTLERLVEHNLVLRLISEHDPRFTLLETIREFGLELLAESGEEDAVQRARAAHYVALAQRAAPELHGPDEGVWLDRLEVELPNLRAALAWLAACGDGQTALCLAAAMEWFWHMRGHPSEGRAWLERALVIDPGGSSPERARALEAASLLAWQQGDDALAIARADAALDLGRALDESSIGAGAASTLGLVATRHGRHELGRTLLEEALGRYRALGDRFWEALSLINLSTTFRAERADRSRLQHEALALFRTQGSPWGIALALFELGRTLIFQGDLHEGNSFVTEGLVRAWVRRDRWQLIAGLELLAEGAAMRGLPERAGLLLGAAAALREAIGISADLIHDSGDPVAEMPRSHPTFASAWEAGKALSLDDAVAVALIEEPTAASVTSGLAGDQIITHGLTRREREVLQRIAAGQSNLQIAHALSLSERTVENHVRHILAKLELPSRTAAAVFAIRQGLA